MINIPSTDKKRLIIVGCGFAGLTLAKKLKGSDFQIVIIEKNNYHTFQPLLYQVASAGLEPSAIVFPLRKIFQHYKDFFIRNAEVKQIDAPRSRLITSLGDITYDYLVLAHGVNTAYFGLDHIKYCTKPMKSLTEAIQVRNSILQNFEAALAAQSEEDRKQYMNIIIVGAGPSGVEISGALAEMRKYILPKDYPELDSSKINIYLIEANDRVLGSMSARTSAKASEFLERLNIKIMTSTLVTNCDDFYVHTNKNDKIRSNIVIWTAGVTANKIEGLKKECYGRNNRLLVDRYNKVIGYENIFAIGDLAFMTEDKYPDGHPQLAQVAIQQAVLLSKNLKSILKDKPLTQFSYKNLGTMATIGRNLAIVELPYLRLYGIIAWFIWMFIHIMSIVGLKNKILIFINWFWSYITYNLSLRLIIKPDQTLGPPDEHDNETVKH